MNDREFYWDWIKQEDNLFSSRTNYFLVGETILFGAYFATNSPIEYVLFLAGLVVSIAWLLVNMSQIFLTICPIVKKLREVEPRWAEIQDKRRIWGYVDLFIGFLLPAGFGVLWMVLR